MRYFTASNGRQEQFEGVEADEFDASSNGFYMGFLKTAAMYALEKKHEYGAHPIVLRVEVPTQNLHTYFHNPHLKNKTPGEDTWVYAQSQEEMMRDSHGVEMFRDVEQFQAFCQKAMDFPLGGSFEEMERYKPQAMMVNFAVEREIPLEWVRGVWDLEKSKEPWFEPLSQYVKGLKDRIPEKLPSMERGTYESMEERKLLIKVAEVFERELQQLHADLQAAGRALEEDRDLGELLAAGREYHKHLGVFERSIQNLEEELSIDIDLEIEPSLEIEDLDRLDSYYRQGGLEELQGFIRYMDEVRDYSQKEEPRDFREEMEQIFEVLQEILNELPDLRTIIVKMAERQAT